MSPSNVLDSEQFEERGQVLGAIHDGSSRQKPSLRNRDLSHEVCEPLSRRTAVRLVANQAVPCHHRHELVLGAGEFVADEVKVGGVH